jgi:L-ascorbate oxidase
MANVRSRHSAGRSFVFRLTAAGAALFVADPATAQIGAEVADPPVLGPVDAPAGDAWRTFAPLASTEQALDLTIDYVSGTIFNPATNRRDKVRLRSYVEAGQPPGGLFISPAIHTRPGQTVRVKLHNRLPADPTCATGDHGNVNVPHCFNGTNLHTHGLWVNPSGNGDNVLLSINPGVDFEYEYPIPPDHPAGTFWYHTHRHGSTAMQVSSGMAGALIIHGNRLPTADSPGDLDTLLADVPEHVLVFQQIQYYCRDGEGAITYDCKPDQVGEIESYDALRSTWGGTDRYTSINGLVLPDFAAEQGRLQRWRMIHGGVRDTIGLQFRKARGNGRLKGGPKLDTDRMEAAVERNCEGETLPFHLVATDGITMPAALRTDVATFQPGYRFDALVSFPETGSYCVIDVNSGASSSVGDVPSGTRLLGMVRVKAGTAVGNPGNVLAEQLVAAAERTMPAGVRAAVVDDLRNGLRLTRFVPHKPVSDADVAGRTQELSFGVNAAGFGVGGKDYEPRPYKPGRLDRKLVLGTAEEWVLTSPSGSHPYHIHVNPFEIVEIRDPSGNDVSAAGASDGRDPQYPGLKGAWKDTLWVKRGYTLKVRTRYQRYIGEFVLHCHILDHEDKGMMQNVAIVLPGGGTPESVNAPPENGHAGH